MPFAEGSESYNFPMPSTHAGFQTTLDLFSMGVELMRQNLRRADPEASADEIDGRLHDWLQERPGAEFGDCTGRVRDLRTPPA